MFLKRDDEKTFLICISSVLFYLQVLDALLNNLQETLELATSRGEGAGPESKVPALLFDAFS